MLFSLYATSWPILIMWLMAGVLSYLVLDQLLERMETKFTNVGDQSFLHDGLIVKTLNIKALLSFSSWYCSRRVATCHCWEKNGLFSVFLWEMVTGSPASVLSFLLPSKLLLTAYCRMYPFTVTIWSHEYDSSSAFCEPSNWFMNPRLLPETSLALLYDYSNCGFGLKYRKTDQWILE